MQVFFGEVCQASPGYYTVPLSMGLLGTRGVFVGFGGSQRKLGYFNISFQNVYFRLFSYIAYEAYFVDSLHAMLWLRPFSHN